MTTRARSGTSKTAHVRPQSKERRLDRYHRSNLLQFRIYLHGRCDNGFVIFDHVVDRIDRILPAGAYALHMQCKINTFKYVINGVSLFAMQWCSLYLSCA